MFLRTALLATAFVLAFAPGASAAAPAPVALTEADAEAPVALAGTGVLVGRVRRDGIRVERFGVGGGDPTTVLAFRPPDGAGTTYVSLSGSATTAAAVVFAHYSAFTAQPFAGPAAGPLTALGPPQETSGDQFAPVSIAVDGDRLIREEARDDPGVGRVHRYVVVDPGQEPAEAVAPRDADDPVDVAGDFFAYGERVQGQISTERPRRVVVGNWRTGERVSETLVRTKVKTFDLRADGRVLIEERGGGVLERAPGQGGLRRISGSGRTPRYAGDAIVFRRVRRGIGRSRQAEETRLFVVEPGPDGATRPIGVPTAKINAFSVDERRVAWQAHGCVLVTRLDAEAAAAPAPGPCARAEIRVPVARSVRIGPGREMPVTLRCLAAAAGACRGSMRLHAHLIEPGRGRTDRPITPWLRFEVPVGEGRRYVTRLTAHAFRTLYRNARDGGADMGFEVRGSTVDPDGRRGRLKGYVGAESLAQPRWLDDRGRR